MAKHGTQLSKDVRRFIVVRLACFETPTEVAAAVNETFGLTLDRRNISHYHPEYAGADLAKEWRGLFAATRKAYLEETADIPVAQQAFRLRQLQSLYDRAKLRGNDKLAAEHLRQAAEEVGEVYTNSRRLQHSGQVSSGVLAVPVPLGAEEWEALASRQQADLAEQARATAEAHLVAAPASGAGA